MQIHMNIDALPSFKNGVVTFGSFDGLHQGHVELFERMRCLARPIDGETIVVTFDPHPRQVIYPNDRSLQLLTTREEKIELMREMDIDHLVICPFTIEFSQISADEYISKFIVKNFRPHSVVIGYDHRFGLNRQGNINFLQSAAEQGNFLVHEIEQQTVDQINISSTKIRNLINRADIEQANRLLGHPYLLKGQVVKGRQIGVKLGYPTANIRLRNPLKLVPPDGIYAARIKVEDQRYEGMLYIGNRPTIEDHGARAIEVNIFDFSADIYDEEISIEILKYIRSDQTFDDLNDLAQQLSLDKKAVQSYLNRFKAKLPDAKVVILNFNGLNHLKNFLPSVKRFTPLTIIVADNASTDESVSWLQANHPDVQVIELKQNYGFAGGYNEALKLIDCTYFILLNSDIEVTSNWVTPLLKFMEQNPDVGAVQPKIKSYLQRTTFEYAGAAGGLFDTLGYPFCQGRILSEVEEDVHQYDEIKETFWCSGAAMVTRKKSFEQFGGFDADFFAHMEEIDYCWRLKQAGYKMMVVPQSVVYHLGGGTLSYLSPQKTYLNFRNGLNLLIKNEKGLKLLWLFPLRIILDCIAALRFFLIGEWGNGLAVLRAYGSVTTKFGRTWRKRRQILALVNSHRVGPDNSDAGKYWGSIIWEFFVLGRKKYADLGRLPSKSMS